MYVAYFSEVRCKLPSFLKNLVEPAETISIGTEGVDRPIPNLPQYGHNPDVEDKDTGVPSYYQYPAPVRRHNTFPYEQIIPDESGVYSTNAAREAKKTKPFGGKNKDENRVVKQDRSYGSRRSAYYRPDERYYKVYGQKHAHKIHPINTIAPTSDYAYGQPIESQEENLATDQRQTQGSHFPSYV